MSSRSHIRPSLALARAALVAFQLGAPLAPAPPPHPASAGGGGPDPAWVQVRYEHPITPRDREDLAAALRGASAGPRPLWAEPGRRLVLRLEDPAARGRVALLDGVRLEPLPPAARAGTLLRAGAPARSGGAPWLALRLEGVPGASVAELAELAARLGAAPVERASGPGDAPARLHLGLAAERLSELLADPRVRAVAPEPVEAAAPPGEAAALGRWTASFDHELAPPFRLALDVVDPGAPLDVRLAWRDPDAQFVHARDPAAPVDELELLLSDPSGEEHAVPRRSLGGGAFEERAVVPEPRPGRWSVRVQPGPGAYLDAQPFTLELDGGLVVLAASAPTTTLDVDVHEGWDSKRGKTLSETGRLVDVQLSDDVEVRIPKGEWLAVDFQDVLPAGVTVLSVEAHVEHWEQLSQAAATEVLRLCLATGAIASPVPVASTSAPVLASSAVAADFTWDVSGLVTDPASTVLVLQNVSTENGVGEVSIDRAFLRVTYQEPTPPLITSTAATQGRVGQPYAYDEDGRATAEGAAPITWNAPIAPSGLTVGSGGRVTWTPAAEGDFPVTLVARNSLGFDRQDFTVRVASPPVVTSVPSPSGVVGVPYVYDAEADGTAPLSWSAVVAPPELLVEPSTGLLTWVPATDGAHDVRLRVENPAGSDEQAFTIQVDEAPRILSSPATEGVVGEPYAYDADGVPSASGTPPLAWDAPGAPAGLAVDGATGAVAWTPPAEGTFPVTLRVANAGGEDEQAFAVLVRERPRIVSTPLATAEPGLPYRYDADGRAEAQGTPPLAWSLAVAPAGASVDPATGELLWTPGAVGSFAFTLRATNAAGSDEQSFVVDVARVPPAITSTPSTTAVVGEPYVYDADGRAAASGTPPLVWGRAPFAPAGFDVDPDTARVTWTPTTAGSVQVGLKATNPAGTATQSYVVRVRALTPSITSVPATLATVGRPYRYDDDGLAEATGTPPLTWSVAAGPPGLSIDAASGAVSWTPAVHGTATVTLVVANQGGSASQTFSVDVGRPPRIRTTPRGPGLVGREWSYDVGVEGEGPLSFELLLGPPGATLSSTGRLAWTPPRERDRAFTLSVESPHGSDLQSFSLRVLTAPRFVTVPRTDATVGLPYVVADGGTLAALGTAPLLFSVVAGPPGLTVEPTTGRLAWTPAAPGPRAVTVRATNAGGSDEASWVVDVQPQRPPAITSSPSLTALVGVPYRYDEDDLPEAEGTRPLLWDVLEGPAGLTVDAPTGRVSWTPERVGRVGVALRARNLAGADVQRFELVVGQGATVPRIAPDIVSTATTRAYVGLPYAYDGDGRAEARGTAPIRWSVASGPPGLSIDRESGQVAWTPDSPGTWSVVLHADNAAGGDAQAFSVLVEVAPSPPAITSWPRRYGTEGEVYLYDADARAEATGGGTARWSLAAGPPQMSVDALTGVVSWTPRTAGDAHVQLVVTNELGSSTQSFTVRVQSPLPVTVLPANPDPVAYVPPERILAGPLRAEQVLNVFLPPGPVPPTGWPVVISTEVGGGVAIPPQESLVRGSGTDALHELLQAGVAVVDYGVTGVGGNEGVFYAPGDPRGRYESFDPAWDMPEKDAVWAVQKVKRQTSFPFDLRRIVLRGSSEGAVLAAWAALGPERASSSGSRHVRTSTRVSGALLVHPPTSLWALEQGPALVTGMLGHFERASQPGTSARELSQVSEELQKGWSMMGFCFDSAEARSWNESQPVCLLYSEPVLEVAGGPPTFALDAQGFPVLHDLLGVPNVHDSWFGYAFWRRLLDLSPASTAFHERHSVFAVTETSALPPPFDWHTATFSGNQRSPGAEAVALDWLLATLDVGPDEVLVTSSAQAPGPEEPSDPAPAGGSR